MPSWKHQKNLTIPDEPIAGVKPSDWNAELNAEGLAGHLVGVPSGTSSPKLRDVPVGQGLGFQSGTLVATGPDEAPSNNTVYGRSNGAWAAAAPLSHTHVAGQVSGLDTYVQNAVTQFGGGIAEAPSNGIAHGRKNGGWVTVTEVNHTHASGQITDFPEAVDDRVATLLKPGTGINLAYNDAINALTITATAVGGGVTDGDKGDITVGGGGATFTIDAGAVSYGKMQTASANVLLGRATAGSGVIEEIPCTSQGRQLLTSTSFPALLTTLGAAPTNHGHSPNDIAGLQEQVGDWVGSLLIAGTGVTLNYNDAANTLTINSSGGGGGGGVALSGYTVNNATTDRVLDADSTSIDELADVVGTLIADIQAVGVGGGGGAVVSGAASLLETRASMETTTIPAVTKTVLVSGFAAGGDGGLAVYKRRATTPYPLWVSGTVYPRKNYVQNSAGNYYEATLYGGSGNGSYTGGVTSTTEPTHTTVGAFQTYGSYGWTRVPQNPAYVRSVDRFKDDGTTDDLHGGWWELTAQGGEVFIEQFGGKADFVNSGSPGTDNWQPIEHAMAYRRTYYNDMARWCMTLRFGQGQYRVSKTIYVYDHINFIGLSGFQDFTTMLQFNNNISGFVFHQNNTGPGGDWQGANGNFVGGGESGGATIRGIAMQFLANGGWITDLTKCAVYGRTTVALDKVAIFNAPGKGVYYKAYAGHGGDREGNANQWSARDLYVHSCMGDAFHVEGADVNGGAMFGYRSHTEVGGCGIRNESWLPNAYHGMQITGYGNRGVGHGGKQYVLILDPRPYGPTSIARTTTPGTNNNIWYFIRDGAPGGQFPAWSNTVDHDLAVPIYDSGGGSQYYNPYVEIGGAAMGVCYPGSVVYGGTLGFTSNSSHFRSFYGAMVGTNGSGGFKNFDPGDPDFAFNGGNTWVTCGGASETGAMGVNGGLQFLTHRRGSDGDYSWQFGYRGKDIVYSRMNSAYIWEITTGGTAKTLGRAQKQPDHIVLTRLALNHDNAGDGEARKISIRGDYPKVGGAYYWDQGEYARGEFLFNYYPTPRGPMGWACTQTGGVANPWTSGENWFEGVRKASNGKYYQMTVQNYGTPMTVEPTHTTLGVQVIGADGYGWTLIQNQPAVWKPVGPILDQIPVTGSRGGNAALASLITALAAYGLITDNTTA